MKRKLASLSVGVALVLGQAAAQQGPDPASSRERGHVRDLTSSSRGTLTVFTDHALWLAAAGGSTTLIDFDSFASGTEITTQLAPFGITNVVGDDEGSPVGTFVTSSADLPFPMFLAGDLPSEPNFLSNDLAPGVFANGKITFELASPATAVGAFIADATVLGDDAIEVFDGASSLGTAMVPGRILPNSFWGVVSTMPFDSAAFFSTSSVDSWGLDDLEHNGLVPECFLVLGGSSLPGTFGGIGHLWTTQLSAITSSHVVTLDDLPTFPLPGSPLPGSAVGRQALRIPVRIGELYAQVLMWNPEVFPSNPEQWSSGLHVTLWSNGRATARPYGARNGIVIRAETLLVDGERHLRFPFTIDGFDGAAGPGAGPARSEPDPIGSR